MILLIDNYDSFTFNLVHFLGDVGARCQVWRNDKIGVEQAIAMAARNGRISFFGGLPKTNPTITCDSNLVHYRQLHIHGANGSAPEHHKAALAYIASGQIPVKDLITRHVPLDRALDALDIVAKGEAIKVTVEP